ncbi:hypothetical protein CRYUN_Cryun11dG0070900 [Craigia yunnanensis]
MPSTKSNPNLSQKCCFSLPNSFISFSLHPSRASTFSIGICVKLSFSLIFFFNCSVLLRSRIEGLN